METDAEPTVLDRDDADEDQASLDEADDSGTGAAIALLIALLSFLLAVTFVILRHLLFHA